MKQLLAIQSQTIGPRISGEGEIGLPGGGDAAPSLFNDIITRTIGIMTLIAAVFFLILILTGGLGIMASGDDKQAYAGAKKKLTNGTIGLLIVVLAVFLADFLGGFVGLDVLNPGDWFNAITAP